VKLTLQIQLQCDATQRFNLLQTMERVNEAASLAARRGFEARVFSQPLIHKRCYREIRDRFRLSAQMAVRAIGKAVEAFKRDKSACPVFRPFGAITYDARILSFKGPDRVSLWALPGGRMMVPMICGDYQKQRLDRIRGQTDLVYRKGKFYLYATVDLPDQKAIEPVDFLGVDLGIANIATDSDGQRHSGSHIRSVRARRRRFRSKLQRIRTWSAKRKLRALSGKERRFAAWVNHNISKQIVAKAKRSDRGIAIEDLTGIRRRVQAGRRQRAVLHSWAFSQLRKFLEYKALLAGVLLISVDPRHSSRTCSRCGHCDKTNRKSQEEFSCRACGFRVHADRNAAMNLRERGRAARKPADRSVVDGRLWHSFRRLRAAAASPHL